VSEKKRSSHLLKLKYVKQRGGKRAGAGRKSEYQEPIQKVLVGLPESVLLALDEYGQKHDLSRPKAIAKLLQIVKSYQDKENMLDTLKELNK
jgi:hypothetical protein